MNVVSVQSVTVGECHLEATVFVAEEHLMRTSHVDGARERAMSLLSGLARHSCDNETGGRFVDELRDTETAHLLEHITVELMALSGSPRTLKGRTEWDFIRDRRGTFVLTIEYDDDLVALGALKEAVSIVDWVMGETPVRPDVEEIVQRLRDLRLKPR